MNAAVGFRAIGTVGVALFGWQVASVIGPATQQPRNDILGIVVGAVVGFALAPVILARPYQWLKRLVGTASPAELVAAVLGLLLGLVAGALLTFPLALLPWWFGRIVPVVTTLACVYLGISFMTMRWRELGRLAPLRSAEHPAEPPPVNRLLIDTSAIIDGRIADISQTGFLQGTLVVPRFVLHELQHIADSPDPLRRNRGRRGLDMLNRLQKDSPTPVEISDIDAKDVPDVDSKLVKLARQMAAPVITNDFNLNRVAELQGVHVLNINQLANALKPVVLPGEEMAVRIIQEGKEFNQGVGYLDDGTMIVVENGRRYLHCDIDIVVTRVLQTVAGRMIFAQPKNNGQ